MVQLKRILKNLELCINVAKNDNSALFHAVNSKFHGMA